MGPAAARVDTHVFEEASRRQWTRRTRIGWIPWPGDVTLDTDAPLEPDDAPAWLEPPRRAVRSIAFGIAAVLALDLSAVLLGALSG